MTIFIAKSQNDISINMNDVETGTAPLPTGFWYVYLRRIFVENQIMFNAIGIWQLVLILAVIFVILGPVLFLIIKGKNDNDRRRWNP